MGKATIHSATIQIALARKDAEQLTREPYIVAVPVYLRGVPEEVGTAVVVLDDNAVLALREAIAIDSAAIKAMAKEMSAQHPHVDRRRKRG